MFIQSLAHGAEEAKNNIEKLTSFLQRQQEAGIISLELEKKIIRKY